MTKEDAKEKILKGLRERKGVRDKLRFLREVVLSEDEDKSEGDSVDKEEE